MSIVFLDESGFTGQDLLNQVQPIFTLATLNFSEEACKELKASFFQGVQSAELKHSSLRKLARQQRMVLNFLEELSHDVTAVKLSLVHKQYTLTAKLVDLVMEPVMHEHGIDLYSDGHAYVLSNLLFFTLPAIGGTDFFENLLYRFQNMVRQQDQELYNRFFQPLFQNKYPESIDFLLDIIRTCHVTIGNNLLTHMKAASELSGTASAGLLDVGLTCTLGLMMKWKAQRSDRIVLIHDESSKMAQQRHIWDALVDPNLPPATFGNHEMKWIFPNAIAETHLESSREWCGLQLADVLAGATTQWAKWVYTGKKSEDTYGSHLNAVIPLFLDDTFTIWPTKDFLSEERADSSSSLDYFSNIMMNLDHNRSNDQ